MSLFVSALIGRESSVFKTWVLTKSLGVIQLTEHDSSNNQGADRYGQLLPFALK